MTWVEPKTWSVDELVTASNLNTHLKGNLNALKNPPTDEYVCDESNYYTTTSTSFVNVDGTNLSLTITTTGGDVMVGFNASFYNNASTAIHLDVDVDGAREAGDDGIVHINEPAAPFWIPGSFVRLITGLSAGSHTFKLQWKVSGGTGYMQSGEGTANADTHPQFWVREVS